MADLTTRAKQLLQQRAPGMADKGRAVKRALRPKPEIVESSGGLRLRAGVVQAANGFEAAEKVFIEQSLANADRFIDVGANIGLYVLVAARAGVPVVAVEPAFENAGHLMENLDLNDVQTPVVVLPVALSDHDGGALKFYNEGTGASLIPGWAGTPPQVLQRVPLVTLDAVRRGWCLPDERLLIKVDVEGAELGVLRGAAETLAAAPRPVWMIEVNFSAHHPGGRHPDFREVFEVFWNVGYVATDINTGRKVTAEDVDRWLASGVQDFGQGGNYAFA